jgi:multiple sugar transport system ATP-binding protein
VAAEVAAEISGIPDGTVVMAEVILKSIVKRYAKDIPPAVNDFNLHIRDKEFVVLVGPSGCGKSTTLRMIAGLEEISEGELYIGDKRVNDVHPKDRDIAMVFQNYALYPHMTVFENMAFGLKLRKVPKADIREKVESAATILNITNLLGRKPSQLSGGQRQRVAIGRAIVRQPQVFLMDEPLSNLDAKLRNQMRAQIIKLRKDVDTTFVYVTHDQIEAMTLGDRIVVMKDGFIMQTGTPREVFTKPACIFVAGFIGSPQMNFIDARLVAEGDRYAVEALGVRVTLNEEFQDLLRRGSVSQQQIVLGVRPEHLELVLDGSDKDAVSAQILLSEMLGSEMFLHVTVNEKDLVIKIHSPRELDQIITETGRRVSEVKFRFMQGHMHLFHKDTGENLITLC